MRYHLDDQDLTLVDLRNRFDATDLIPSQLPLLEGLSDNMTALEQAGICSVADLRAAMKTAAALRNLAERSGVDGAWLALLNRALKGFFPKPRALKEFAWLSAPLRAQLQAAGLTNSKRVFEAFSDATPDSEEAAALLAACDLCRIQWVSPSFARALVAGGYVAAADLALADPETVEASLAKVNVDGRFFKGKVGARDIRRLVVAARYAPQS